MKSKLGLDDRKKLRCIAKLIAESGKPLTRTSLKRNHAFSNEMEVEHLIDLAEQLKLFAVKTGGYVTFNKDVSLANFDIAESDYYDECLLSLSIKWKTLGFNEAQFFIENTSRKDTNISGRWTRPDLTLVSYKKYPYTIGFDFDIVTFEIKRPKDCNVLAVFEALSHRSAATKSYVVFPISKNRFYKESPEQAERVYDECHRHGVGLIFIDLDDLLDDVFGYDFPETADIYIDARKKEIDHERSSNFIEAVFSSEMKKNISTWK